MFCVSDLRGHDEFGSDILKKRVDCAEIELYIFSMMGALSGETTSISYISLQSSGSITGEVDLIKCKHQNLTPPFRWRCQACEALGSFLLNRCGICVFFLTLVLQVV